MTKTYLSNALKGFLMGAANVIPGVSGGTIAFITGIYEDLIGGVKSFDLEALKLLRSGRYKDLLDHVKASVLIPVFIGTGISVVSLAKILKYLFELYPIPVWAFFFGLILASIYFVGRTISNLNSTSIASFIVGTSIAVFISMQVPAQENSATWYLIICGAIALCSMILPGLSGSFVLLLMGNYTLIMVDAVSEFNIAIIAPFAVGGVLGLLAFSHFLNYLFKNYKDGTISLMTGFILGSLLTIWPWKNEITDPSIINSKGIPKVIGYDRYLPTTFDGETIIAFILILVGIISVYLVEKMGESQELQG